MIITFSKVIGGQTVTVAMPNTRQVTVGMIAVGAQSVMADGSIVMDTVGVRHVWTAAWDYVPGDVMTALYGLLAAARVLSVTVTGIDGTAETVVATVSMPESRYFSDKASLSRWHGVTLTITERTVRQAVSA